MVRLRVEGWIVCRCDASDEPDSELHSPRSLVFVIARQVAYGSQNPSPLTGREAHPIEQGEHSRFFEQYTVDRQEVDKHWIIDPSKRQNFRIRCRV